MDNIRIEDHYIQKIHSHLYFGRASSDNVGKDELIEFDISTGITKNSIEPIKAYGVTLWWKYQNRGFVIGDDYIWSIRSHDSYWSLWRVERDGSKGEWGILPQKSYLNLKYIKHIALSLDGQVAVIASVYQGRLYFTNIGLEHF